MRTIPWASVADWYTKHEQQIRDVMKFEGLKGAVVEVLRLAPDQPELAASRKNTELAQESMQVFADDADRLQRRVYELEAKIEDVTFKIVFAQSVMLEDERGQRFVALLEQLKGYLK